LPFSLPCLLMAAAPALAQDTGPPRSEVEGLRRELEALRQEYSTRLADLEARLQALQTVPAAPLTPASPVLPQPVPPAPAEAAPSAEAAVPAGAAGAGGPSGTLPVYGAPTASSKIFNPDIALIGNFLGAAGETPADGAPSLEMEEAEASFQAVVDPYARADFFLTFGPEEVGIEEAYLTFPALPGGFLMKAGKMRDAFGKVNALHPHNLPWADRPLVTQNLLGGEEGMADSGISLSRLLPNPWLFLEATGQVYQGNSEIFAASERSDLAYLGHLRAYHDLGESTNLELGGSFAWGHNDSGPDATTRLWGVDATFRYRPLRRSIYRRLLARTELAWSRREQEGGARDAFGVYGSAEYQFARRWFVGARVDYSQRADDPSLADKGGSLLMTFWPSEFSQLRGQYRRTRFGDGGTADEFLFQLLFTIGAHGAHPF
jgi:hypothetical protein